MKAGSEHLFPVYQVDAFADQPFRGNPAAVVFLMGPKPDSWLQAFAQEMNLSETAYFMRTGSARNEKGASYQLRWFTPTTEVDLCGHATLATAHVIWETGLLLPDEEIRFSTRSGLLRARKEGDWIAMDFPSNPPVEQKISKELQKALGAKIVWSGTCGENQLVELESEAVVRGLTPDLAALKPLTQLGLIVTAPAEDPQGAYHFVSRFFAPAAGIDEDPVTGSAHCSLGPYWADKLGQLSVVGYQASARGGIVKIRLRPNGVELRGKAVTIFQGVITN